nr:helix-turn-helix domain-containing protein [Methylacidimicrobium sp. B4]
MLIAHRIALDPNNAQATHLARAAGTARFADEWNEEVGLNGQPLFLLLQSRHPPVR